MHPFANVQPFYKFVEREKVRTDTGASPSRRLIGVLIRAEDKKGEDVLFIKILVDKLVKVNDKDVLNLRRDVIHTNL